MPQRAHLLFESAMDPIVTIDEDQRIVAFNAAAEAAFGWTRDETVGRPLDMLIPERFRDRHHAHVDAFAHTGTTSRRMGTHAVLAGLRRNGEEFPIEASISQYTGDDGKRFTVILRDVTERVHTLARLATSEARMRGILDSAMDAIITVDENQNVVLFNRAAETMFRMRRQEAIGAPLSTFVPERFRAGHASHVNRFGEDRASSRRMADSRVVTGVRSDGEEFPIDAAISHLRDADHVFYTVILRDVSARETALADLRQSKRELHDELGQALTMMRMDVAWCKANLAGAAPNAAAKLDRMENLLKTTVAAARRIASDLRPLMLDDLGLAPALEWLVQNMSQRTGLACDFSIDDPAIALPPTHSTAVFRIVQEALTNIAKHARGSHAAVAIRRSGEALEITIRDDGVGFPTDDPRKPESFGLLGLRERVSLLRGTASIQSAPGAGTTIVVTLPLAAAEEA